MQSFSYYLATFNLHNNPVSGWCIFLSCELILELEQWHLFLQMSKISYIGVQ